MKDFKKYLIGFVIAIAIMFSYGAETDQSSVDTTTSAFTIPNGMGRVFIDPASIIAAKTITLPPNPPDQFYLRIVFGGSITGSNTVITLCTFAANTGQTILGATTGLFTAGTSVLFIYRTSNSSWYRAQ